MIPRKTLKSGVSMPVLGLGTWLMGGNLTKQPSAQDILDIAAIKTAVDFGYTHIDTAENYADGYTEELIATALKDIARDKVFLASKAKHGHHTKNSLPLALEQSLKRLNVDHLDLYYLHRPTLETPLEETAEALNKAFKQGKFKYVGVCNFAIDRFDALQKMLNTKIVANQVHYNLAFREPELVGMLDHALLHDYFVMAWRPLRLRKLNTDNATIDANVWDKGAFPILDDMAQKYNKSNTQIALNWLVHNPQVITLTKSSQPERLKEAALSFDFTLDISDHQKLSTNFMPIITQSDVIPLI
jgi:diketogulonate reductase-like aldo/keto reductase